MKATFLHEALHHVDAEAKDKKGMRLKGTEVHDEAFRNRLRRFKKDLRVKSEMILKEN